MDFLTLSSDPWRICVDRLNTLADPADELVAPHVEVTLRVTYSGAVTDLVIPARKHITRKRVAWTIRNHIRAVGRAEGGRKQRDYFLLSVLPHESESGVWVVSIETEANLV